MAGNFFWCFLQAQVWAERHSSFFNFFPWWPAVGRAARLQSSLFLLKEESSWLMKWPRYLFCCAGRELVLQHKIMCCQMAHTTHGNRNTAPRMRVWLLQKGAECRRVGVNVLGGIWQWSGSLCFRTSGGSSVMGERWNLASVFRSAVHTQVLELCENSDLINSTEDQVMRMLLSTYCIWLYFRSSNRPAWVPQKTWPGVRVRNQKRSVYHYVQSKYAHRY